MFCLKTNQFPVNEKERNIFLIAIDVFSSENLSIEYGDIIINNSFSSAVKNKITNMAYSFTVVDMIVINVSLDILITKLDTNTLDTSIFALLNCNDIVSLDIKKLLVKMRKLIKQMGYELEPLSFDM